MSALKVSIISISYNQEAYISDTLDGFVSQKTDFEFEVIIGDDASTDKTAKIIKEYATKYPDIIKPILRKKNLGPQKNFLDVLRASKGEYIALCEGDDYWTDSLKLQKQVDFMDAHPGHALCFHPVRVFFEDKSKPDQIYPKTEKSTGFRTQDLLKENFIQTNSVLYRRQNYKDLPDNILPLDWFMHLYHAQFGEIGFIKEDMAAYRRHKGGIWWEAQRDIDEIWKKHGTQHLALYTELLKLYGEKITYRNIILGHIGKLLNDFMRVDADQGTELLKQALAKFPDHVELFLRSEHQTIQDMQMDIHNKYIDIQKLNNTINDLGRELDIKNKEINDIKSSMAWKMGNKFFKTNNKDEH